MMRAERSGLDALFRPRAVAIVGASGRAGNRFARPLKYMLDYRFQGKVYPVNPRYESLGGVPCFPSLLDVPEPVDLVCSLVPANQTVPVLEECGQVGAGAAIVYASGFSELDAAGAEEQDRLCEAGRRAGVRVLGPNCLGFFYLPSQLVATFSGSLDGSPPLPGPVAYVGQSGAVGGSVLQIAREAGLGMSVWASTGNQCDISAFEIALALVDDPAVGVITLYLEDIGDGDEYVQLACTARDADKPLVVLRAGRSLAGRRAATSHTGSMIRAGAAFDLLSRREGVVLVSDIPELVAVAGILASPSAAPGSDRVALVTSSGGAGILAADQCEEEGLKVEPLDPRTKEVLAERLPPYASVHNPVDVTASVFSPSTEEEENLLRDIVLQISRSPNVDMTIVLLTNIGGALGAKIAAGMVELVRTHRVPLIFGWLSGRTLTQEGRDVLREAAIPVFDSISPAVRVAKLLADRAQRRNVTTGPDSGLSRDVSDRISALLRSPVLTESDGGPLLDLLGIARPWSVVVGSAEEALAASTRSDKMVALKAQSSAIAHKSDVGGVRLHVGQGEAGRAYEEMTAAVNAAVEVGGFDGRVMVQEMAPPGREVLVGAVNRDGSYPPVITVGMGGTGVEIYKDTASAVGEVDREEALRMIASLRGAPLLFGHRGGQPVDVMALADVIVKVSQLMSSPQIPRIAELELNPVLVYEEGLLAADFWLTLGD
jgi:acyl-CoA synthetase (NDP forming)